MKIFKIASTGWEIYGEHSFVHETKTAEEFNEDCRNILKQSLTDVIEGLEIKDSNMYLNAYELMDMSIEPFKKLGYSALKYEETYILPGDDGSYINNEISMKMLKKEFGDEISDKFINKAKELHKKYLDEE